MIDFIFRPRNKQEIFIITTGLAALVHSTWALAYFFGGEPPTSQNLFEWAYWLVPAALIAWSLDVGQISTSAQIREGSRSPQMYLTFAMFALATYYLQWLYLLHHLPVMDMGAGVAAYHQANATTLRDLAVWILPSFLPASTLLYTFSSTTTAPDQPAQPRKFWLQKLLHRDPVVISELLPATVEQDTQELLPIMDEQPVFRFQCPDCSYDQTYTSALSMKQGQLGHRAHCPGRPLKVKK